MEIDLSSIIVGIIALSFFFVPIAYYQISQKRSINKLNDTLKQIASKHQISLTKSEIWSAAYGIGIDEISKKIIYFKQEASVTKEVVLSLKEIEKVKIIKTSKTLKNGSQSTTVTDIVGLSFQNKKIPASEVFFEFYNYASGRLMNNETALAERWKKLIQEEIR